MELKVTPLIYNLQSMLAIDIWKVFDLLKTLGRNRTFTGLFPRASETYAFTNSATSVLESGKATDANLITEVQETVVSSQLLVLFSQNFDIFERNE